MVAHQAVKKLSFPRSRNAQGAAIVEMVLVLAVGIPLLFGIAGVGLQLGRTIEGTQVTRDVAHMYALGADFSLNGSQAIARALSPGFRMTSTGNAVLILSSIVKVFQLDCNANSLKSCPNLNQTVFAERIVIGNASLRVSAFGTPPASYIDSSGNIRPVDYCQQATLIAHGFDTVISLQQGQSARVVEGYFSMPELNLIKTTRGGGYYVRMLF